MSVEDDKQIPLSPGLPCSISSDDNAYIAIVDDKPIAKPRNALSGEIKFEFPVSFHSQSDEGFHEKGQSTSDIFGNDPFDPPCFEYDNDALNEIDNKSDSFDEKYLSQKISWKSDEKNETKFITAFLSTSVSSPENNSIPPENSTTNFVNVNNSTFWDFSIFEDSLQQESESKPKVLPRRKYINSPKSKANSVVEMSTVSTEEDDSFWEKMLNSSDDQNPSFEIVKKVKPLPRKKYSLDINDPPPLPSRMSQSTSNQNVFGSSDKNSNRCPIPTPRKNHIKKEKDMKNMEEMIASAEGFSDSSSSSSIKDMGINISYKSKKNKYEKMMNKVKTYFKQNIKKG